MQKKIQPADTSSDAGAFAAGQSGAASKDASEAYAQGAPIFDRANDSIANNQSGGAGYFAEAHHTASMNIDANSKDIRVNADRLGSTAFGSPDIVLNTGEQFNPKFYETASGSYGAGAELVNNDGILIAKYAEQTIIVPSDQLDQVQQMHQQAIQKALELDETEKLRALESLRYDDRIRFDGAESQPLTYEEAQAGAEGIRGSELPGYVGEDTGLFGTATENALLAASIALATSVGPQLIGDTANVVRGKMSIEEATSRLQRNLGDAQTKSNLGWATARGAGAAALTFMDAADPTGAALVVNLVVDTMQLSIRIRDGKLSPAEFRQELGSKIKDRAAYTALTAGAFWCMGLPGLLVPIIVRRVVADSALQREAINAWSSLNGAMHAEIESRIKGATLLATIEQRYRSAEASSKSSNRSAQAISDDLTGIRKLLGYGPGTSSAATN